jgi:hypothetical protein
MPICARQSGNNPSRNERPNQLTLFTPNKFRRSIYNTSRARNLEKEFQATNTEYKNLADRYRQRLKLPHATPIDYLNVMKHLRTIKKLEISDPIVTESALITMKTQKRMRINESAQEQLTIKNIKEEKIPLYETITKN